MVSYEVFSVSHSKEEAHRGKKKHEPRKKRKTFEKKQPTYSCSKPHFIEAKYPCSEENYSACAELAVTHFNIIKSSRMRVLGDVSGCSFHRGSSQWHHVNFKAASTEDETPKVFSAEICSHDGPHYVMHCSIVIPDCDAFTQVCELCDEKQKYMWHPTRGFLMGQLSDKHGQEVEVGVGGDDDFNN